MTSLTVEEIQKSLANSMMAMQIQMEQERECYKKKIQNLERINKEYKIKIDELNNILLPKKINKIISDLNAQLKQKEKELEIKIQEHQKDVLEILSLKNQIQLKEKKILNLEKKMEIEDYIKKNPFIIQKKENEEKLALQNKIENNKKIIIEKDNIIEELKRKNSNIEEKYKGLLKHLKEIIGKEEIFFRKRGI